MGVTVIIGNGGLGKTAPNQDAIMGYVFKTALSTQTLLQNVAYTVFSLSDAENIGITKLPKVYPQALSTNNEPLFDEWNVPKPADINLSYLNAAWEAIDAFYKFPGNDGKELWLMAVDDSLSIMDIVEPANNYAKKLLDAANGRIKVLGVSQFNYTDFYPILSEGMHPDIRQAITNAQLLAAQFAENQSPLRIIIDGAFLSSETNQLIDNTTRSDERVAVTLISTKKETRHANVGFILGRLAAVSLEQHIGHVGYGALPYTKLYLTNTVECDVIKNSLKAIGNKGYIVPIVYARKSGYYIYKDITCTSPRDDFSNLRNGRVIDKAQVIAYNTFIEHQNETVLIVKGKLDPLKIASLEAEIQSDIKLSMVVNQEISSIRANINPNQNILSTGILEVVLKIVPVGYLEEIIIRLGFENPQL